MATVTDLDEAFRRFGMDRRRRYKLQGENGSDTTGANTQHVQQGDIIYPRDLSVSFMTDAGSIKAVEMNFTIPRKTVVGVVGESGSGKSVTACSIIKLLPETATTSGDPDIPVEP